MKSRFTALLMAAAIICGCSRSLPANGEKASQPIEESSSTVIEKQQQPVVSSSHEPQEEQSAEPQETSLPESEEPLERDWRLILVNPDNLIPDDYEVELATTKYGYQVDARIVDDVEALIDGAAADGVQLLICYGYRTIEQSQQLFEKQIRQQLSYGLSQEEAVAEAKRWVAPPKTSDHHTGLALDIVTPEYQVLNHGFYNTPAGRWMAENCWDYGFVIRFPEDKQDITGITYEPWHLRFVGKENSLAMRENNECLEEYVARLYG